LEFNASFCSYHYSIRIIIAKFRRKEKFDAMLIIRGGNSHANEERQMAITN